ncbi:MAG: DUF4974 domain-containing protein [Sphingobacterium sp.]|jgi:ferric-dicitrate binding protein FerR (iron transport regulator)|nr:DUF4974 domain-containing protein [Sphingobacterium sp.]
MDKRLTYLYQRYIDQTCTDYELNEFFQKVAQMENESEMNILLDTSFDEESIIKLSSDQKKQIYTKIRVQHKPVAKVYRWKSVFKYVAAAMLVIAAGSIYWLQHTKSTFEYNELEKPITIQHDRIIILPDSSVVVLNKDAKVAYTKNYGKIDRVVNLVGEAYFSVTPDKNRPFIVVTKSGIKTRVLGTKFNIKALDTKTVEVTVSEGKVQVESETKVLHILEADQQLIYSLPNQRYSSQSVDASKVVSWQNKDLYFNNLTLGEIGARLEKKYQVKIELQGSISNDTRLSATFLKDESLEDVLNTLTAFLDAKYEIDTTGRVKIYR